MWYDEAQGWMQRQSGGFRLVWWSFVWGELDLGYILWQLHCLGELMIRVCLVSCREIISVCVSPISPDMFSFPARFCIDATARHKNAK